MQQKWAYYNEFDPNAAAWLRELIKLGAIMDGEVDERSITEVQADDLKPFVRCGFFAGIGGWDLALRRAGWPDDKPVWHGSCPCQDFSCAGKQKGFDGERDLWPAFFNLIRECRPERIFGEQVKNAVRHGWLDRLYADLETEGYACGSSVLGAHSAGADHIRQRIYWMADASRERLDGGARVSKQARRRESEADSGSGGMGDTCLPGPQGHGRPVEERISAGRESAARHIAEAGGYARNFWSDAVPHLCKDGKYRRFEPRVFKMVTGLSLRVGYGGDPRLPPESSLTHTSESCMLQGFKSGKDNEHAATSRTYPNQALSPLFQKNGTQETTERNTRSALAFQQEDVLQSKMHGRMARGQDKASIGQELQETVGEVASGVLREVRGYENAGGSPSRLESHEQRSCEFDDFVRALPYAEALARVEGDNATLEALLGLRRACEKEGDVSKAFSTLEEIWRSLSDKEKHRVWMGFGAGRFLTTHGVVASNGIFPLVAKLSRGMVSGSRQGFPIDADQTDEARVMRLKGYGNAICVDTAALFIRACDEVLNGKLTAGMSVWHASPS